MGVCVCVFSKALLMFEVQNDTNVCPHLYSRIITVERTQCTFFNAYMYATFLYIYHERPQLLSFGLPKFPSLN